MKREYILDKQEQLGIQDKMAMLASLQAELKNKRGREKRELDKEIDDIAKSVITGDSNNRQVISDIYGTAYFQSKATKNGLEERFRSTWKDKRPSSVDLGILEDLGLNNHPHLQQLFPNGTWQLHISFELMKPYLSRDDQQFYIIENPIRKEWVFKNPYIAPSQWKGMLRAAMINLMIEEEKTCEAFAERRLRLSLLFGDEKGELENNCKDIAKYLDESGPVGAKELYRQKVKGCFGFDSDQALPNHSGNLHFFPSFFEKTSLEVINPHSRKTGAGDKPILFEIVPEKECSTLNILYVPMYGFTNIDYKKRLGIASEDLECVTRGIKYLFSYYGIGAKTSSGFGLAQLVNDEDKNRIFVTIEDGKTRDYLGKTLNPNQPLVPEKHPEADSAQNHRANDKKNKKGKREQLKGLESLAFVKSKLNQANAETCPNIENSVEIGINQGFKDWKMLEKILKKIHQSMKEEQSEI